jgi:hypothetical protein
MPYIPTEKRKQLLEGRIPITSGELNYMVTQMCRGYIAMKGEGYQTYNDIMGVLEGAKMEMYRRKIAPYEDKKMSENGDVY